MDEHRLISMLLRARQPPNKSPRSYPTNTASHEPKYFEGPTMHNILWQVEIVEKDRWNVELVWRCQQLT
ncbi:hypothetical protein K503DRAFT_775978 [Rhizopogon vinicolor AM-OR11-026]|uniref:Uncharacterized protein n=1 Tax=Rhizopogon vinicolor AM-OR11-026 TaxID=1314800 RepID=A0A1B7MKI3_9AGAM|nr:hypothetical protein K503DRAFT_775978 [Rhizopogon vinicolor AM-OR11-026]